MEFIQKKITKLVKEYNTANPFKLCEYLDIKVMVCKLAGNGFYYTHKRIPIIFINETLDEHRQMAACAHELAHHLLHKRYNTVFFDNNTSFKTSRYEKEADEFSRQLIGIYYREFLD